MSENLKNVNHEELDLNDLNAVAGGAAASEKDSVVAFCTECHRQLKCLGTKRIMGGTTNIFKCMHKDCGQYDKVKTNLEVNW